MVLGRRNRPGPTRGADTPEGYSDLTVVDRGGFAVVYRARDERFDRTVALKILDLDGLDERSLRRFRAECMATGRVSAHPNIVTVYDAGTTGTHKPWLAMEYCSGGSLAARLEAGGPMPVPTVLDIGVKLSGALHAAHTAGVLHRDVKPQNVLTTAYGEPALADFGIARLTNEGDGVTETAAFTVVHSAPEILEGHDATTASDLYSLGSTLWTLLAGRAPYAAEAAIGLAPLVTRILRNDVPALPRTDLPPGLEDLLRRAMTADPSRRPGSAAELAGLLADIASRVPGASARPPVLHVAGTAAAGTSRQGTAPPVGDPAASSGATARGKQVAAALHEGGVIDAASTHALGRARPAASAEGLPAPGTRPTSLTGAVPTSAASSDLTHRRADLPELERLVSGGAPAAPSTRRSTALLLGVFTVVAVLGVAGGVVWGLTSGSPPPSPAPTPAVTDAAVLPQDEAASRAPRDVVVDGLDGGRLSVQWTLPDPSVLPLLQLEPPVPSDAPPLDIRQGIEEVTVAGLQPGTSYCVTVIGFTKQGERISAGQGLNARACGTPR